MNRKQKLHNLIESYQRTRDDLIFSQIYEMVTEGRHFKSHDLHEVFDDKLTAIIDVWDRNKGDFDNMLNKAYRLGKVDLLRKATSKSRQLEIYEMADTDDDRLYGIADSSPGTEEQVIAKQKTLDQRQLIEHLTESADEFARQCVASYLENGTLRATAKSLTEHPTRISRTLTKLARQFDGDINDYLYA